MANMLAELILISPLLLLFVIACAATYGGNTAPKGARVTSIRFNRLAAVLWLAMLMSIVIAGVNNPSSFSGQMEFYWIIGGVLLLGSAGTWMYVSNLRRK